MPHLRGGNNVEGRRLFAMEGAAAPKLMAAGLELNRFLHDGNQIGRSAHLVFFLIANHGCSPPAHPNDDGYRQYYPRRSRSSSSSESNTRDGRSQRVNASDTEAPYRSPAYPIRLASRCAEAASLAYVGGRPDVDGGRPHGIFDQHQALVDAIGRHLNTRRAPECLPWESPCQNPRDGRE